MISAGLMLFRVDGEVDSPAKEAVEASVEVLLGHMGGPFWARKDDHAWSIPKGLQTGSDEDLLDAAEREFAEEMGSPAPAAPSLELGQTRSGSKTIVVFAREGNFDAAAAVSNTFEMEWPPKSGRIEAFPEIDRVEWMTIAAARSKLVKGQQVFLDRLAARMSDTAGVAN